MAPLLPRGLAGGWSNGSVRLTAAQVEELYKERLYLSVSAAGSPGTRQETGAQGPRLRRRGGAW